MFYSHTILTSREHGVATVWLVATLGSKSSLRTVTRKKILDVDVHKACDTIQNPEAPMALRLQGNLLYGVARVYSQQCAYVLADAQAVRDKVRGVSMIMKDLALDSEAGKVRPDQLNLPDDPAFMPELDLNFDLSAFGTPITTPGRSSLMSPPSLISSRSSQQAAEGEVQEPSLELPSGNTSHGGGFGEFDFGLAPGMQAAERSENKGPDPSVLDEETGILDVGWEFDEHGNMIETAQTPRPTAVGPAGERAPATRIGTDSGLTARVRQEHVEGSQAPQKGPGFDDAMLAFGEDEYILPEARPFSPRPLAGQAETVQSARPRSPVQQGEEETPPTAISAPHLRTRMVKPLGYDERPGLTNQDLRQWNEGYLENMQSAVEAKHLYKLAHQAKKNAEHWVLGRGIGGVGRGLGQDHACGPLQMYCGATLLAAVTGKELSSAGTKHARSPSVTSGAEEERRVRTREETAEQVGRGADEQGLTLTEQDEGIFIGGDEMDVEVGRTAPEQLLEGRTSQMPWDVYSASRQGSIRPFGSAAAGMTSSVGGTAQGLELGPPSALSRRGSRLMAASPLQGRGPPLPLSQRISIISTPERERGATTGALVEDEEMLGGELPPLEDESEEFQLHGLVAGPDTQTAGQSHWVAAALDSESRNFLDFLDAQIQAQAPTVEKQLQEGVERPRRTATFEGLLPPGEHTKVVAAQAFMHVLTLASQNWVSVRQDEGFGDLELAIAVDG